MYEILLWIVILGCIVYLFKGNFSRKQVAVTVVKNLPLGIFKKSNKEVLKKGVVDEKTTNESKAEEKSINESEAEEKSNELQMEEFQVIEEDEIIEEKIEVSEIILEEENKNDGIIEDEEKSESYEKVEENNIENKANCNHQVVYWTPKGKSYHLSSSCRTLSRSKIINSGTLKESGKELICDHCK